ncbi:UNVERIFIED_CONTAM: hypothetical protein NCL1_13571 [Trichonephila clavipes]
MLVHIYDIEGDDGYSTADSDWITIVAASCDFNSIKLFAFYLTWNGGVFLDVLLYGWKGILYLH